MDQYQILFQQIVASNINKKEDREAFDLQNMIKSGTVFFYFDNFNSLILADNIVISLSFVIIYGNILKYISVTAQSLL